MNREILQDVLSGKTLYGLINDKLWLNYINFKKMVIEKIEPKCASSCLVSEANWLIRNQKISCEQLGVQIRVGDICYIDFGQAYINESGYQHFALVFSIFQNKAFVIPMTSNSKQYASAYDPYLQKNGKLNLMKIGLISGMKRSSVLFLNDCKYINTARIIDVKANIDPSSKLFQEIKERVQNIIFN
ncbi:MAG: type II toxin-antitoxin system PemK/MazF family toxin [Anaerorhabdus sp.]